MSVLEGLDILFKHLYNSTGTILLIIQVFFPPHLDMSVLQEDKSWSSMQVNSSIENISSVSTYDYTTYMTDVISSGQGSFSPCFCHNNKQSSPTEKDQVCKNTLCPFPLKVHILHLNTVKKLLLKRIWELLICSINSIVTFMLIF